mmetsp:Transcript_5741/g.16434  ORF Transcript_5741/g.16434 Transcript_5741/m.16434 type:complete len:155 (-) Transcript_5741:1694-2158(-)
MMEAQAPTGGRASTQLHTCSHMQPGSLWRRNGAITGSSSSGRSHHVHCIPPQRKSAPSVLPSAQHTTSRLVASAARDETVAGAASSAVEQSTDASLDLRQQEAEFRQVCPGHANVQFPCAATLLPAHMLMPFAVFQAVFLHQRCICSCRQSGGA